MPQETQFHSHQAEFGTNQSNDKPLSKPAIFANGFKLF